VLKVTNGFNSDAFVLIAGAGVRQQVYIKANGTLKLERIPDCLCRVLFVLGTDWDSNRTTFTRVSAAEQFDDAFNFTEFEYSISLNPVPGGTATTHKITKEDFAAIMAQKSEPR
jgi:hypothetical protein